MAMRQYVSRDATVQVSLKVSRFVQAVEQLFDFPEPGRVVPELGDSTVREVISGSCRIVYRVLREHLCPAPTYS